VDVDKHKACTAPNLVHSLDASLLHFTFAEWDKPFTVIHDCAMGRSCDMAEMAKELRLHFAEMYKGGVLEDWARQVGAIIPDGLIKGELDIDLVNQSAYFFC
jgi:DNA-directed RNA polymerase